MYRREEGRYEHKRRDRGDEVPESKDNDYKSSRRNRWDDRGSESVRSSDKRREDESRRSLNTNWEGKGRDYDRDRESSASHSRCRERRSQSRSRSPFRRNFRDCANPSKDEYSFQNEVHNHSLKKEDNVQHGSSRQNNTSWSDSSEEDERSGKANSNNSSNYGRLTEQQHFGGDTRKHNVPHTGVMATQQMKPFTSEDDVGNSSASSGISLKLGGASSKRMPLPKVISVSVPVKSSKVAAIFNTDDDDDEPEDMPPECKMRMKNVGRETKTSEGPNSFGKTKIGFCNMSHLAEKHLEGKPVPSKKP